MKLKILAVVILFCFTAITFGQDVQAEENTIDLRETKGLALCDELHEILSLPENRDVMMTSQQRVEFYKNIKEDQHLIEQRKTYKEIIIPKNYKHFRNPKWMPVSDDEVFTQPKLKKFVEWWKKQRVYPTKYKQNYVFEKAKMDIDRDGVADILYRQKGADYHLILGQTSTNRISDSAFKTSFDKDRGQALYYKEKPYFLYRGGLSVLSVMEPIIWQNTYSQTTHFRIGQACQYRAS